MNELVTIEQNKVMDVFTKEEELQPVLDKIADYARKQVVSVETEQDRKEVASLAYRIAQSKTYIENHGKELAAELKSLPKLVDKHRKQARDFLDNLKAEIRKPLTEWENEQEAIKLKTEIEKAHEEAIPMNEEWDKAAKEKAEREARERAEYEAKIKAEAEEAAKEAARQEIENAKARAEEAERRAKEEKEQQKRQAEEEKERIRQEEIKRLEEEQRQKEAEKEAEHKRIQAEKENEAHRETVHNAIFCSLSFICGLTDEQADSVLDAIKSGAIHHVTIEY